MKEITMLFVDDEPINRLIFGKSLEDHATIILGDSGEQGLQLLANHPEINVLVSDFSMPGMSGVDFIKAAKLQRPELPCFMHSAVAWDAEIEAAQESGLILNHFPKPLMIDQFLRELNIALAPL